MIYHEAVLERAHFCIGLKGDTFPFPLLLPKQVHGKQIYEISGPADSPPEADGIFTRLPGLGVAVKTADCLPLLFSGDEVVGAVHAGWRGLASGVIPAFLSAVGHPESLDLLIGPAIGPCCYEVGRDVAQNFQPYMDGSSLDLRRCAVDQLLAGGVQSGRIEHFNCCTKCSRHDLPSYRREGERASRIISAASLLLS